MKKIRTKKVDIRSKYNGLVFCPCCNELLTISMGVSE